MHTNSHATSYIERVRARSTEINNDKAMGKAWALPKCTLVTGQRAFAFRGAKIFDSLP